MPAPPTLTPVSSWAWSLLALCTTSPPSIARGSQALCCPLSFVFLLPQSLFPRFLSLMWTLPPSALMAMEPPVPVHRRDTGWGWGERGMLGCTCPWGLSVQSMSPTHQPHGHSEHPGRTAPEIAYPAPLPQLPFLQNGCQ